MVITQQSWQTYWFLSVLEEIFSLIWKLEGLNPSKGAFSHALEEPREVNGTAESSGVVVLKEVA